LHPIEKLKSRSMIEEQRPDQAAPVSPAERRKNPRTPIRRLAYVNLEPYDNGGVVTDISGDGLRFHVVNPVEHGGLVRLSILLGGAEQLQVVGELVWLDATRKVGGVRFTVLPEGAVDRILNWAETSNGADTLKSGASRPSDATAGETRTNQASPEPEAAAVVDNSGLRASPGQAGPQAQANARSPWVPPSARPSAGATQTPTGDLPLPSPNPPLPNPPLPNPRTVLPQPWMSPAGDQQPNAMPWITHFDPDPRAQRSSIFVRGVLGGMILCVLLGSAAWFGLRQYGSQNSIITLSAPLVSHPAGSNPVASGPAASSPIPSAPLAPQPALPSADIPSDVNAAGSQQQEQARSAAPQGASPSARPNEQRNPRADAESAEAPPVAAPGGFASPQRLSPQAPSAERAPATTLSAQSGSPEPGPQQGARAPASQLPPAADAGESQLMLARQYLDGRAHPRNPTVASQLLWSAVEKGNSAAEMDLADLYLRGDGVARNCDQARVLLSVASGKGNPEAMQKLSELNRTGCR
jgi:hypothetical protein